MEAATITAAALYPRQPAGPPPAHLADASVLGQDSVGSSSPNPLEGAVGSASESVFDSESLANSAVRWGGPDPEQEQEAEDSEDDAMVSSWARVDRPQ